MQPRDVPAIIVSAYMHLPHILDQTDISHVVSILGQSDKLDWPDVGSRRALRLRFDDCAYSSGRLVAPNRELIADLIEFARNWNGVGTLLVHCRAGSSRSPAGAMIAAAALGRPDGAELVLRIRAARSYFTPNENMLKLADSLLGTSPGLVAVSRSVTVCRATIKVRRERQSG